MASTLKNVGILAHYPYADFSSPINNWRVVLKYELTTSMSTEQAAAVMWGKIHLFSDELSIVTHQTEIR